MNQAGHDQREPVANANIRMTSSNASTDGPPKSGWWKRRAESRFFANVRTTEPSPQQANA